MYVLLLVIQTNYYLKNNDKNSNKVIFNKLKLCKYNIGVIGNINNFKDYYCLLFKF